MSTRKAVIVAVCLLIVLWWLMPPRQLGDAPTAKDGVVEIAFMGPGGPLAGAMADVIRAFEVESEKAHAADPTKPIYRVVSGQDASRDQTSDPTRFLVSVAGDCSPYVIKFDLYATAEWAARGGFEPLDDFLARDQAAGRETPSREKFFKAPWDEATYAGKQYGIPISVDSRVLMYNRDAFRRAGLVDANGEPTPP